MRSAHGDICTWQVPVQEYCVGTITSDAILEQVWCDGAALGLCFFPLGAGTAVPRWRWDGWQTFRRCVERAVFHILMYRLVVSIRSRNLRSCTKYDLTFRTFCLRFHMMLSRSDDRRISARCIETAIFDSWISKMQYLVLLACIGPFSFDTIPDTMIIPERRNLVLFCSVLLLPSSGRWFVWSVLTSWSR